MPPASDSGTLDGGQCGPIADENWGVKASDTYRGNIKSGYDFVTGELYTEGVIGVQGGDGFPGAVVGSVVDELNLNFHFRSEFSGINVRVAIDFYVSGPNAEVTLQWLKPSDVVGTGHSFSSVRGRMDHGTRVLKLNRNSWQEVPFTPTHEMGHGFGLNHAPVHSGSFMGPGCAPRAPTFIEGVNLWNLYR